MSLTQLHNTAAVTTAGVIAGLVGVLVGRRLVELGLAQLNAARSHKVRPASYVTGTAAGIAAVLATRHAGSWWALPATLVWAYALVAAATCDAFTQRVPTPLVRQAIAATGVLVLLASAATGHWRWAALAAVTASAAGIVFAFCWRFLGAGFGDVRIALLGGIGVVHPTNAGVAAAIAALTLVTLGQAVATLARGGNRHTHFPYGPAIAATFLVLAVI